MWADREAYCFCDGFELGYWEGLDLRVSIFFARWEVRDVTGDMLGFVRGGVCIYVVVVVVVVVVIERVKYLFWLLLLGLRLAASASASAIKNNPHTIGRIS